MNNFTIEERWRKLPEPIRDLSRNNPAVYHIAQMYAHGHIITQEEALCQMIIHLSKDWSRMKKDYIDMLALHPTPLFVQK